MVLLWFSVDWFWCQSFGDVHIKFSSVRLLSGHILGNSCSLGWPYVLVLFFLFVILVISRFGFEGWIRVLIASVPDLCIFFIFICIMMGSLYLTSMLTLGCHITTASVKSWLLRKHVISCLGSIYAIHAQMTQNSAFSVTYSLCIFASR